MDRPSGNVVHLSVVPKAPIKRLRILHCLRAPVGGLFRHVRDLAREQAARGHEVGIICDANTRDPLTEARLLELAPQLALGLHKVSMSREVGLADISAARTTRLIASETKADVLHGHGAKGGAYARVAGRQLRRKGKSILSFYTPHGGSLHYDPATLKGRAYMAAERHFLADTSGLIFESRYAADVFSAKVATPTCPMRIIHNGILPDELRRVDTATDAADFLFIGELRMLKGVDVLLDAIGLVNTDMDARVVIVGAGPDEAIFRAHATRLGLDAVVRFAGAMPAREAFRLGRILVLPSRAESFPYVALESAGAAIPLIATAVGGIPEIVEGTDTVLVPAGDAPALAAALRSALASPLRTADKAERLQRMIAERFSVQAMADGVLRFYAASSHDASAAARA